MAHQAHFMAWKSLASNLRYKVMPQHGIVDQYGGIFPLDKETQSKEFAYFGRRIAKQIREFGASERAKYESQDYYKKRAANWVESKSTEIGEENEETSNESTKQQEKKKVESTVETRMVYSNEVRARYWQNQDDEKLLDFGLHLWGPSQKIEDWLDRPGCSNIDLGDTIKIMMMEASATTPAISAINPMGSGLEKKREAMESLLLMANHPRVSISSFRNMHHGHHFGVSRVAEEAMKAYVYLNILVVLKGDGSKAFEKIVDINGNVDKELRQNYMAFPGYARMLRSVAGNYDGDAQNIVHQDFFYSKPWTEEAKKELWDDDGRQRVSKDVLADMDELREYLKGVWRVMVTYDIIIREEGGNPEWEEEFRNAMIDLFGAYFEYDK